MISIENIRSLAQLARLKLTGGEEQQLQKDISGILDYVGQVSAAPTPPEQGETLLKNVMRDDVPTPVLGLREALVAAFPTRKGDYNLVRKIIDKDAE